MFTLKPFVAIQAVFFLSLFLSACDSPGGVLAFPSPTTTVPALRPSPTFIPVVTLTPKFQGVTPAAIRGAQWSATARGLTVGLAFEPFPLHPSNATMYRVALSDANGQPVMDAVVSMDIVVNEVGMEGDDDETFMFNLKHEGNGVYTVRTSIGGMNQTIVSCSLSIKRGGASWGFVISRSELGLR